MARLLCGDAIHDLDRPYRAGALAARAGKSFRDNPHRDGSMAHGQWKAGHENEEACEHVRAGSDVIRARRPRAFVWEEDPKVPRDEHGCVDAAWYGQALKAIRYGRPA